MIENTIPRPNILIFVDPNIIYGNIRRKENIKGYKKSAL